MAQTIKLKRSATAGNAPSTSDLALGEVAINTYDGKIFIKKNDGSDAIVQVNPLDTDDLSEGSSNLYFTESRVLDALIDQPLTDIEYIDLVTALDPPAYKEGRIFYHDEYKTPSAYIDESDVTLQIGFEEWTRVYNNTGSTILNGTPVYVTGAQGETPTIAPADASTEAKARVFGVATHDITNNSSGIVTTRGLVSGIDTSGLTAGQPIHVAPTGGFQTSAPTYPYFPTDCGGCVVSDASNGYIYINITQHTFKSFRVTGNSHLDGNLTVDGNFTVNGTQSIVSQNNLSVNNSFVYLNSGDTIGDANTTFTGSGLDDAYFTGHFEGTATKTYYVRIDGVGTGTGGVDTFEWSYDDFATTEATGVDLADQVILGENICIHFNAFTGHTSGDEWEGSASPVNVDSGWFSNRNTGTTGVGYTHMGIFFDVSDGKFKVTEEYDPEPTGTIDTEDASYTPGTLVAGTFEGGVDLTADMTGSGNIDISGDITTSGDVDAARLILEDATLSWNNSEGTVDLAYDGVVLQIGQEQHFYAKATEAIANGEAVMFAGAQGGHLLIAKADATATGFKDEWVLGLATDDIANNEFSYVTPFGKVRGLDTSDYNEGDILYLDPTTPGGLTDVAPVSPNHVIRMAAVINSHGTQGTLFVRPVFGSHLGELHDVAVSSASDKDRLAYNASTEVWENVSNDMSELNNDMWEVTTTVPTDGSGKPAGYVWYVV